MSEALITFSSQLPTTQCLAIKITDDFNLESTETFNVEISSSDRDITISTPVSVVTILDNDMIGIGLEEEEYEVAEGDGSLEVCVVVTSGSIQRQLVAIVSTADITAGEATSV